MTKSSSFSIEDLFNILKLKIYNIFYDHKNEKWVVDIYPGEYDGEYKLVRFTNSDMRNVLNEALDGINEIVKKKYIRVKIGSCQDCCFKRSPKEGFCVDPFKHRVCSWEPGHYELQP